MQNCMGKCLFHGDTQGKKSPDLKLTEEKEVPFILPGGKW